MSWAEAKMLFQHQISTKVLLPNLYSYHSSHSSLCRTWVRPSELDLGLSILPYPISPSQVGLHLSRVVEQGGFAWFIQISYRIEMWRILVFSDSVAMSLPVFDIIQPLWASCTGIWPRGSLEKCFQSFLPFILCRLEQQVPGKAIGKQTFSGAYYEIWFC